MDSEYIFQDGVVARYYAPERLSGVGVIIFDGAGGGFPIDESVPSALAAAGHPALAVAYFRNGQGYPAELPASLQRIPVEYVFACMSVMTSKSGVPADQIVLMGQSRGAELVLLAATHISSLAGVVAFSPSDGLWQASTFEGEASAAWTRGGEDLPFRKFTYGPGQWQPASPIAAAFIGDDNQADIPVQQISCPVMLISSEDDRIWPATKMANMVAARMKAANRTVQHLQFPDASHVLMGFGEAPIRVIGPGFTIELGGSKDGTRAARDSAWSAVLAFLAEV